MVIRESDTDRKVRFSKDIYYTDITTYGHDNFIKSRNNWLDMGFKVVGDKVYIPKGIYDYHETKDNISQLKLKDKWIPAVLIDEISYGGERYPADGWEFIDESDYPSPNHLSKGVSPYTVFVDTPSGTEEYDFNDKATALSELEYYRSNGYISSLWDNITDTEIEDYL